MNLLHTAVFGRLLFDQVSLKNTELAKSEGRTAPLHGSILIHGSSFSSSPASTVALAIAFGMGVSSEAPAQSEETGSQAEVRVEREG